MPEGHLDAVFLRSRLEHCVQASGEAVYTSDVALGGDELYCYPVESTQALAMLVSVDASKALEVIQLHR